MKSKPFSIRMFLPDGDPDGLRIVKKSNWIGLGLVFPRHLLAEIKIREEFDRTGVYILLGDEEEDDDTEFPLIYIGQGAPVRPRLEQHVQNKSFWNKAVFFTTLDNSLNKALVGHLELQLIKLAQEAKRSKLDNTNTPNFPPLNEDERADMDNFLDDLLEILPILGVDVFQIPQIRLASNLYFLNSKGISATGYITTQGFVVKEGSTAVGSVNNSLLAHNRRVRDQLIKQNVLVPQGVALTFTQDYSFSSPSMAAAILRGCPSSGPALWKNSSGNSLKEIQDAEIEKQ